MINTRSIVFVLVGVIFSFGIILSNSDNTIRFNSQPSIHPPNDMSPDNIPQFVLISSDDNYNPAGLKWLIKVLNGRSNPGKKKDTVIYSGEQISMTFFWNTSNGGNNQTPEIVSALRYLNDSLGCEISNHTANHEQGGGFSVEEWKKEMKKVNQVLKDSILKDNKVQGFRTPFLEYNKNTFKAVKELGLFYDSSIEEGFQKNLAPGKYYWPYTLNYEAPGYKSSVRHQELKKKHPEYCISKWNYKNLWEIPCYAFQAPPDSILERKYKAGPGLRKHIQESVGLKNGKINGLDWNLWAAPEGDGIQLNKKQTLAVLKYSFDKTYNGNRVPFSLVIHSPFYFNKGKFSNINNQEQREVIKKFLDYILTKKDVRIVSIEKYLKWLIDPVSI